MRVGPGPRGSEWVAFADRFEVVTDVGDGAAQFFLADAEGVGPVRHLVVGVQVDAAGNTGGGVDVGHGFLLMQRNCCVP